MTTVAGGASPRQLPLLAVGVVTVAAVTGGLVAAAPTLIVPAGLALAIIAAALVSAEIATLAVLFLLFLNVPGLAVGSGAPLIVAASVPLVLGIPLLVALRRGERIVFTPTFVCMLVLLLIAVASSLASAYTDVALENVRTFLFEGVLLYFLVSNVIRTPATLRRAMWALLAAGACLALVTIVQATTQTYYRDYGGFAKPDPSFLIGKSQPRATGPLGDPNYYGQILIVAVAIGLIFAWRASTPRLRLLAGGATAISAYAIALTYSRGTAVALLVLLILMAAMRYFRGWQILAMIAAVGALLVAVPSYADRVATLSNLTSANAATGSDPAADESAQGRSTELKAGVAAFVDHPVLGVGPGVFPLHYREYAQQVGGYLHDATPTGPEKGLEAKREAHNIVVAQAADLGLVGLLTFCGLVGLALGGLIRVRAANLRSGRSDCADLATALLLAVLAYLLTGMFLTLAYETYFWMLLGLAGAATSVALREHGPTGAPASRRMSVS
ncbi:MAG TPA: O-antigen ligase family protein [Solirubrobacteraceae bacterium]|nr:O-antigen ligase family protein [Solirubrobacteraceae bacterium]